MDDAAWATDSQWSPECGSTVIILDGVPYPDQGMSPGEVTIRSILLNGALCTLDSVLCPLEYGLRRIAQFCTDPAIDRSKRLRSAIGGGPFWRRVYARGGTESST